MRATNWSQSTTDTEANHRAAGRRRYNKRRQIQALERQEVALNMWWYHKLSQAEIARRMGVHRSTICRYLSLLRMPLSGPPGWRVKTAHGIVYRDGQGFRTYGYR